MTAIVIIRQKSALYIKLKKIFVRVEINVVYLKTESVLNKF